MQIKGVFQFIYAKLQDTSKEMGIPICRIKSILYVAMHWLITELGFKNSLHMDLADGISKAEDKNHNL